MDENINIYTMIKFRKGDDDDDGSENQYEVSTFNLNIINESGKRRWGGVGEENVSSFLHYFLPFT